MSKILLEQEQAEIEHAQISAHNNFLCYVFTYFILKRTAVHDGTRFNRRVASVNSIPLKMYFIRRAQSMLINKNDILVPTCGTKKYFDMASL